MEMSLEIDVANASNLPNLESMGKIDPYVKITIQGELGDVGRRVSFQLPRI